MSVNYSTTVPHELTPQDVCDLLVTAFEGGSNHWLKAAVLISSTNQPQEEPWYSDSDVFDGEYRIELTFDNPVEGDDMTAKVITQDDIQRGLEDLGRLYPFRAQSVVEESVDADDADTFLQLATFGEVIYG